MTLGLILLLALAAAALLLLPLLPSLREISSKVDAKAISVRRDEMMDTRHFAQEFSRLVNRSLGGDLDAAEGSRRSLFTQLTPDEKAMVVPGGFTHRDGQRLNVAFSRVLASAGDLYLAEGVEYRSELYARGSLDVGRRCRLRAAYAEQDVVLASRVVVDRWVHARRQLRVEADAVLYGRGSADDSILLEGAVGFSRLRAPTIEVGAREFQEGWRPSRTEWEPVDWNSVPHVEEQSDTRVVIEGDLDLPPFHREARSIVVHGDLRVRKGVRIDGSVKVHGTTTLEDGVRIDGSLVGIGPISMATGVKVGGPLLTERNLVIGRRCKLGDVMRPTTVRAERIQIGAGSVAHGALWASLKGVVKP